MRRAGRHARQFSSVLATSLICETRHFWQCSPAKHSPGSFFTPLRRYGERGMLGRGDEFVAPETFSVTANVVPGRHSPRSFAWCPGTPLREAGRRARCLKARSSRSRQPNAPGRACPKQRPRAPRTRHPRSRRRSIRRHARAPVSCRKAGCRCRRAWHAGCVP